MKTSLRLLTLLLAAAGGLTAAPTIAADATLGEPAAIEIVGSERWSLRPTRVAAAATSPRSKTIALSNLPNERRLVRVIYQGYSQAAMATGASR